MNAVTKRRSLSPAAGSPPVSPGTHAMRRGTARREVTERVTMRGEGGRVLEGWALNASRGGLRAIREEKVDLGHEFDVLVGDVDSAPSRRGRIVWLQDEPDGVIVGVEYTGLSGIHRSADGSMESSVPPPSADASAEVAVMTNARNPDGDDSDS